VKPTTQIALSARAAAELDRGARLLFAATIILIPFRLRWILLARPQPPLYRDYTDLLLFAPDAALLGTLALWLASSLLSRRRPSLGPRAMWIPLAILTLAGWASVPGSLDPVLSAYQAIRLLLLFWFYVYVVNQITGIRWVVLPVAIQVCLQAIVALAQFIAQRSVDLQQLGELELNPAWAGISVVIANGVRLLRAYGLSDHPNLLGGMLAFGLIVLLGAYLHGTARRGILATFVAGSAALLVTFSRSGWLAFVVGACIILTAELLQRRWESLQHLYPLVLACVVVPTSLILAYSTFFGVRIGTGGSFSEPTAERQSIGERFLLVDYAWPILLGHTALGVGLGASPAALELRYPSLSIDYQPPHWALLDAVLETGLPGGVAYGALMILPFVSYVRGGRVMLPDRFATVALALLAGITVVGFFDYYTWLLVAGRMWQWLGWGLWALVSSRTLLPPMPAAFGARNDGGAV
jgi:hypothetical protein